MSTALILIGLIMVFGGIYGLIYLTLVTVKEYREYKRK